MSSQLLRKAILSEFPLPDDPKIIKDIDRYYSSARLDDGHFPPDFLPRFSSVVHPEEKPYGDLSSMQRMMINSYADHVHRLSRGTPVVTDDSFSKNIPETYKGEVIGRDHKKKRNNSSQSSESESESSGFGDYGMFSRDYSQMTDLEKQVFKDLEAFRSTESKDQPKEVDDYFEELSKRDPKGKYEKHHSRKDNSSEKNPKSNWETESWSWKYQSSDSPNSKGSRGYRSREKNSNDIHHLFRRRHSKRGGNILLFMLGAIGTTGLIINLMSQENVPFVNKSRSHILSYEQELDVSQAAWENLSENPQFTGKICDHNHESYPFLIDVAHRLLDAAGIRNLADWELILIDDDTPNAFVLPNGKIVVHTGILKILHDSDGAAMVLGHEMSHVILRHVGNKFGTSIFINILSMFAFLFTGIWTGGIADIVFTRQFSREYEYEADELGLEIVTRACFDPLNAIKAIERLAEFQDNMGAKPAEYLSTHPSTRKRAQKLKQLYFDKFEHLYGEFACESDFCASLETRKLPFPPSVLAERESAYGRFKTKLERRISTKTK